MWHVGSPTLTYLLANIILHGKNVFLNVTAEILARVTWPRYVGGGVRRKDIIVKEDFRLSLFVDDNDVVS